MNIQEEAEQLLKDINKLSEEIAWRLGTSTKQSDFLRAKQLKKERLDLILSSFKRVSREAWDECSYTCACLEDAHTRMVEPKYYENFDTYWQSLTNQEEV